jgi:hypothetical protein
LNVKKVKNCIICSRPFVLTYSSTQKVCSMDCAIKQAKQTNPAKIKKDKEWKVKKTKLKKDLETVSELIKKVEYKFNRYIRLRDLNKPCVSCNKHLKDIRMYHAGHFYSAGHHSSIRFNELNVHGQCVECNVHKHGNGNSYRKLITKRINQDQLKNLDEIANQEHKWVKENLNKLLIIYSLKVKILEKEKIFKNNFSAKPFKINVLALVNEIILKLY